MTMQLALTIANSHIQDYDHRMKRLLWENTFDCGCCNYVDGAQHLFCHLHQAAPDLLAALKDLVEARRVHMGPSAVNLRYKLAEDAIAKAQP